MPYADREKRLAAQRAHYVANKPRYRENQRRRRADGREDRSEEYMKRRAARPARPPKPKPTASPPDQELSPKTQRLINIQRKLKSDALMAMGLAPDPEPGEGEG